MAYPHASWHQPRHPCQVGGVLKGGRFLLQRPPGAVPAQLATVSSRVVGLGSWGIPESELLLAEAPLALARYWGGWILQSRETSQLTTPPSPPSLPCPFTSSLVGGSNPAWVSIIIAYYCLVALGTSHLTP